MNVIVFQNGARHNYSIIRFLHEAGWLRRFYTDLAFSGGGDPEKLVKLFSRGRLVGALERRTLRGIPSDLIVNSLVGAIRQAILSRMSGIQTRPYFGGPWTLKSTDLRGTDIAFTQYFTGAHCLKILAANGTKIVSDVIITPLAHKISSRERQAYPAWGEAPHTHEERTVFNEVSGRMIAESHALFCPSEQVIQDVGQIDPSAVSKCYLVPYASALQFEQATAPLPKRVLYAGSVTLHKGPQYLFEAAKLIAKVDRDVTFVIAGSITETARRQLAAPNVQCLGPLSAEHMKQEFARADVFALPTLAEGRAGVVLEAMAAGVPVVTTRAAGVDIANGETGYCVPERDAEALAAAILKIVHDRELRRTMSVAARTQAKAYDMDAWRERFLSAIQMVHEGV